MDTRATVAVFIDLENTYYSTINHYSELPDWSWIVDKCNQQGRIILIKAFCDWREEQFRDQLEVVQQQGIEPIFTPLSNNRKSSLDGYLIVSAMKLLFHNKKVDTFVIASGDRDYIPMILELKALGKKVILLAIRDTLSRNLIKIADDVIYYKDKTQLLSRGSNNFNESMDRTSLSDIKDSVVRLLKGLEIKSVNDRWVNLATIGLALKQEDPDFTHEEYGYSKLVGMLDDIPQIELKYDNYEKTIALARIIEGGPVKQQDSTLTGVVDNTQLGYGFIRPDDGGDNLFFHHSKLLNGMNLQELQPGDRVSYSTYNTERGLSAENIAKLI